MKRGEIWWANLPEPWGRRPVLLVARSESYTVQNWVMVAPLTTHLRDNPASVLLHPARDGVPRPSVVKLDSIHAIPKMSLDSLIGQLQPERLAEVERAVRFAFALGD